MGYGFLQIYDLVKIYGLVNEIKCGDCYRRRRRRRWRREEKVMELEGVISIALLPSAFYFWPFHSSSPHSTCYGLHGTELECERECSRGEDYRLIKLTVTDFNSKRERSIVVECKGHDAAKISTPDHAHGWQKDIVGMVEEEKHAKRKTSIHFECETLKSDEAADDHLNKFMPKLVGMGAVVNIGRMTVAGLDFEADAENRCSKNRLGIL